MSKGCFYHREEKLTNFCCNKQCSLPLCPKCIHEHLSVPGKHHILSLDAMIANIRQSLIVSIEGLESQMKTLAGPLQPQKIQKQFVEVIQKYRKQNIQQINLYYKNLQKDLLISIQSIYSQHLSPFLADFEQKLSLLKKYNEDINRDKTLIATIININCNNQLQKFQELFAAFLDKRTRFKQYLPSIDLSDKGRLQLKPQSSFKLSRKNNKQIYGQTSRHPIQRISDLEERLYFVRSRILE